MHVAPEQSPPQFEKVQPAAGVAVNATVPAPMYNTRQAAVSPLPHFVEFLSSVTEPTPSTWTRTVVVVAAARPPAPPTPIASATTSVRPHPTSFAISGTA